MTVRGEPVQQTGQEVCVSDVERGELCWRTDEEQSVEK